jgi:hypothetical protein
VSETVSPAGLILPVTFLKGEIRVKSRDPRPEWITALRTLSPMSAEHSWLYLAWEPGDDWSPIERWMLYQVVPRGRVPAPVLGELEGPDPRSEGHYCGPTSLCGCAADRRPDLWVGGAATLITRRAWEHYRATAALGFPGWAKPWWVIQGDQGGHPRFYTNAEAALADLADLPSEPPVPGELAYAEPDQRTWNAITQADRVRQGRALLTQRATDFAAEDRARAVEVRRATLDMLRRTAGAAWDEHGAGVRAALSEYRLGAFAYDAARDDEVQDPDIEREAFLQNVD